MKIFGWRLVRDNRVDCCEMCEHCDRPVAVLCDPDPPHEYVIGCLIADDPLMTANIQFSQIESAYKYTREKVTSDTAQDRPPS